MPFSSSRSVRAPASNATRAVTARVPGIWSFTSGRPVGRDVVAMSIMEERLADRRPQTAGGAAGSLIVEEFNYTSGIARAFTPADTPERTAARAQRRENLRRV